MSKKISKQVLKYTAIFEPAEEGGYVVTVPSLPGCFTEGDSLEEAMEMVKDAISAYIVSLRKHGEPIPVEKGPALLGVIDVPAPAIWMPKPPVIKPKELIKALKKKNFVVDHVSGSHYVMYNADKSLRAVTAFHNKPIKRKTIMSILKSANISVEELKELL